MQRTEVDRHGPPWDVDLFQLAYGHSRRLLDDETARGQATAAYRALVGSPV